MLESYSKSYAKLWRKHWWWRVRHELMQQIVEERLAATSILHTPLLLDIGCAGGLAFDELSRFGDVYGLEPDPRLVDSCPQWRDRIEMAAFGRDYRTERKYDLVLMLDVLEHIEDDRGALDNLINLLKPGGHLILTVPALQSLWSVHDEVNHHFRRYDRKGLHDLLINRGFEVTDLHYLFTWSLPLMYLRKLVIGSKVRLDDDYAVNIPPRPINSIFAQISRCEQWLVRRGIRWMLGSSLLAVARRPGSDCITRDASQPS